MKKLVTLSLLALALAFVPVLASAQNTLTQFPTYCTPGGTAAQNGYFVFAPQGGAYTSSLPAGLYLCIAPNVAAPFSGGGASKQLLLSDVATTTALANAFSYQLLPYTNYSFSCTLFWQNSSTNAETFTVTTPSSPTAVLAFGELVYNAAGGTNTAPLTGTLPTLTLASTAAGAGSTTYKATISGGIQNGANAGGLAFGISAAAGTATAKAGSYCTVNSAP